MLPTFIIIGAMKGGTTALYRYLSEHPEVCMSSVKETDFFALPGNFGRGRAWYESLFKPSRAHVPPMQYGEASPNYSKWPRFPGVPERMHAMVPNARLIYVVRDPVARMISHYAHNVAKRREPLSLDEALLSDIDQRYSAPSRYFTQLSQFLPFYPLDRILVLTSEALRTERRKSLRRVFAFLEIDPAFDSPLFNDTFHGTSRKFAQAAGRLPLTPRTLLSRVGLARRPPSKPALPKLNLADACRNELMDRLRPEVEALRRLTGQPFDGWCV